MQALFAQALFGKALFAIGMPGTWELLIIAFVIVLLFGSARLPSLMRNLGRSATEFQKGMKGINDPDNPDADEEEK